MNSGAASAPRIAALNGSHPKVPRVAGGVFTGTVKTGLRPVTSGILRALSMTVGQVEGEVANRTNAFRSGTGMMGSIDNTTFRNGRDQACFDCGRRLCHI